MFKLHIEGRRIIPIRAIPEVTCQDISPFEIAWILAEKIPEYHPKTSLDSYHFEHPRNHYKMFPREWDVVIADLERLESKLGVKEEKWTQYHPIWREKSIAVLPRATFAWWDEFEIAHSTLYPEDLMIPFDDRPGYLKINENPRLVPAVSELIYEGFDILLPPENSESSTSTDREQPGFDMDDRELEIGLIARRIRRKNPGLSEREIAKKVYVERKRKGPKQERLRQIIRKFQKK